MIKYIFLILIMFSSSNNYETQQYDIISSDDDFEIRFYHSAIKAKVISKTPTEIYSFFNL